MASRAIARAQFHGRCRLGPFGRLYQSLWTHQEVGFASARDVPIVPILNGEVPSGFLAQIQGFPWQAGQEAQLAPSILDRLNQSEALQPKLGEGLANALKHSESYQENDRVVAALLKLSAFQRAGVARYKFGPLFQRSSSSKRRGRAAFRIARPLGIRVNLIAANASAERR